MGRMVARATEIHETRMTLQLAILSSSLLFGAAIIACFSTQQGYRK